MKSATQAMTYERISNKPKLFLRKRPITRQTNDFNKLSTLTVLARLYKRHERVLLEVALAVTWTLVIVKSV